MFSFVPTTGGQEMLSLLQGVSARGSLFVNIYSLTQRSVRHEFLGRSSGVASSAHYLPAAFSGMLLGWMVGHLDWGLAAIIQLGVFPALGIGAMLLFDYSMTSRLVVQEPSTSEVLSAT